MKRVIKCPWCGAVNLPVKMVDCGTFWTKNCTACDRGFVIPKPEPTR